MSPQYTSLNLMTRCLLTIINRMNCINASSTNSQSNTFQIKSSTYDDGIEHIYKRNYECYCLLRFPSIEYVHTEYVCACVVMYVREGRLSLPLNVGFLYSPLEIFLFTFYRSLIFDEENSIVLFKTLIIILVYFVEKKNRRKNK